MIIPSTTLSLSAVLFCPSMSECYGHDVKSSSFCISIIINTHFRAGVTYKWVRRTNLIRLVCSSSLWFRLFFSICFSSLLTRQQIIKLILVPKYEKRGNNRLCYLLFARLLHRKCHRSD